MIKRIADHRILTAQQKASVTLDFNCLLGVSGHLQTPFVFMHWNKVLKKFAFYDPQNQIYRPVDADKIIVNSHTHSYLDVEKDNYPNLLPTAVIAYTNAVMRSQDDGFIVIDSADDPFKPHHQGQDSEQSQGS